MCEGGHASELDRREICRLIHQNLVTVMPQDGLERCPGGTIDIALNVGPTGQITCGAQDREQYNVQFERMNIAGFKAYIVIPALVLLSFAPERSVTPWNTVKIPLHRIHEAARI